jgi:glycosyltransferase involved in cell wall biosynthesis
MKRVLILTNALDLGGAETHVISLAGELTNRGYSVSVGSNGGRLVPQLAEAGVRHYSIPLDSRSPADIIKSISLTRRLVADEGIELIHAQARIPAFVADRVGRAAHIPYVTTYHGTYQAGLFWRIVSRFGARTIAVSDDVRHHLIDRLGAPAEQVVVIPNGIDTVRFSPTTAVSATSWVNGIAPCIVHVGRLDDSFADAMLASIGAMPVIRTHYPGATLLIAGDGNRLDDVQRAVAEANRLLESDACQALGHVLDTPELYNRSDIVIGVARSAMEGMACGRPIIISGEGGYAGVLTRDQIANSHSSNLTARGRGVPVEPALVASGVNGLLADGQLRVDLGQAGREHIVAHCSIAAVVDQTEAVYREVCI